MSKKDPCVKCKNPYHRIGGRREFGQCRYGEDLSNAGSRVFHLPPCARTLRRENAKLDDALKWIAQQPCQHDAEGASDETPCSETGACITEWCLPCYAKAARIKAGGGE